MDKLFSLITDHARRHTRFIRIPSEIDTRGPGVIFQSEKKMRAMRKHSSCWRFFDRRLLYTVLNSTCDSHISSCRPLEGAKQSPHIRNLSLNLPERKRTSLMFSLIIRASSVTNQTCSGPRGDWSGEKKMGVCRCKRADRKLGGEIDGHEIFTSTRVVWR